MTGFSADATTVEVGTSIAELAIGVSSPVEAKLLPVGCEHGVFAFGVLGESGGRFACCGLVCLAICWEVSGGTATKTMGAYPLLRALYEVFGRQGSLRG